MVCHLDKLAFCAPLINQPHHNGAGANSIPERDHKMTNTKFAITNDAITLNSYARDVEAIRDISDAKKSVVPVVLFVLTTIQAGLSTCKGQIDDVNTLGAQSRFMWGKKGDGLEYTKANDGFLYGKIKHIEQTYGLDSVDGCVEAIELFLNVPNLGMVKAAFVAQMFGFNVACIDSHNLKRLGLNANAVKLGKVKPATRRAKIADYVKMTQIQDGHQNGR